MSAAAEFFYKLPGTTSGSRPGAHASLSRGSGMAFAAHASLFDVPDPRRIDFRASFTDVRRDWLVRTHLQRSTVTINVIADASASMRFGDPGKLQVLCDFLTALGNSAHSCGDAVSFYAYDRVFREDLYQPKRTGRASGIAMSSAISATLREEPVAGHPQALVETVGRVGNFQGITFLASDFHWNLDTLTPLLPTLSTSLVVPLVIWNTAEMQPPANGSWLTLRDMESSKKQHLWLNSKVRDQWRNAVGKRRSDINQFFSEHDIQPHFVVDAFNAEELSRYFMENIT